MAAARYPVISTLGWAFFLGCSWTWCIGMFLPVLLMRDYGPLSWVAFAIPNVVGAAAMGWVLSRDGHSESLVTAHRTAATSFSVITLAFHVIFAFLVLSMCTALWIGVIALALLILLLAGVRQAAVDLWTGVIVWVVSIVMLVGVYFSRNDPGSIVDLTGKPAGLWAIVPVMIFGFVLCPYLDLTFHRARQALPPHRAKWAFGIGFGVVFFIMIVGTFIYARAMSTVVTYNPSVTGRALFGPVLGTCLALHMGVQAAYTAAVHARQLQKIYLWMWLPLLIALAIGGALLPIFRGRDMSPFEGTYRVFMAFYGLVFPAYVWLCMIPSWNKPVAPTRRAWTVLTIAIIMAAPLYWLGFIERKTIWLLPGVAIMLLARFAITREDAEFSPLPPGEGRGEGE